MKTRLFISLLFLAAAGCQAIAPLSTATAVPSTVTAAPPSPSPAPTDTPLPPTPTVVPVATLKVVSSLPMTGILQGTGEAIANAMKLRLKQANNAACGGKYAIQYEVWDDVSAATGNWDAATESANARKAVADKSVIAYLGPHSSGAAKASIPILNKGDLVMISPSNTYPGLTKPGTGDANEPNKYYPDRVRNYARVIASDDVQGAVDARYMFSELGVRSVFILDDQESFGVSIARAFEASARSIGMTVTGHKSINPKAGDYTDLMKKIATSNGGVAPDGIFAAVLDPKGAAQVVSDKVTVLGDNTLVKFMGPESIQSTDFIDDAGGSAEGAYASINGRAFPDGLTDAGKQFVSDYEAAYGKLTEPYAIYGYEAMSVLLQAIENSCIVHADPTGRERVRYMVFGIRNFSGVLGTWSFDKNGDTTLSDMTIYQVKSGAYEIIGTYR